MNNDIGLHLHTTGTFTVIKEEASTISLPTLSLLLEAQDISSSTLFWCTMKSSRTFGGRARTWFKFTGKRLPTTTQVSELKLPSSLALIPNSCEKSNNLLTKNADASLLDCSIEYSLSPSASSCSSTMETSDRETDDSFVYTEMKNDSFTLENGAFTSGSESVSSGGEDDTAEVLDDSLLGKNVFEDDKQPLILDSMENARLKTRKRTFGQRKTKAIASALDFEEDVVSKRPRVSDYSEEVSQSTKLGPTMSQEEMDTTSNETTGKQPKQVTVPENDEKPFNSPKQQRQSTKNISDLDYNEYDDMKIEQPTSRTSLELAKRFFEKLDQEQLTVSSKGDMSPPPLSRPIVRTRRTLDLENNPELARLYQTHVNFCRGAGVKPLSMKAFWEQRKQHHKPSDRVYNGFFDED